MFKAVIIRQRSMKPNVKAYNKAMHKELVSLWRGAAKAFIDALIQHGIVKVDTGMSKASIIPLAERLRLGKIVRASISSRRGPRVGYTDIRGVWHPRGEKSQATGERLGEKGYTFETGSPDKPDFRFRFRIVVYQWAFHESQWGALDIAQRAFIDYANRNKNTALRKALRKLFKPTETRINK